SVGITSCFILFSSSSDDRRDLHSFPTRRSSDLRETSREFPPPARRRAPRDARAPRWRRRPRPPPVGWPAPRGGLHGPWDRSDPRSEEHTSELQSRENLVCRLLLEKKKYK